MTILKLLKAQCRIQGVPEIHAEQIEKISGITEEKDGNIPAAVKNFKENILPIITQNEESVEEARRKAVEEAIEQYKKEHGLAGGVPTGGAGGGDNESEVEKELAAIRKKMAEFEAMQGNAEKLKSVKAQLEGKLKPEFVDKYASRVNLNAENLDDEIEKAVKEYNDDRQLHLNAAVESGGYQPVGGSNPADRSVEDWVKLMDGADDSTVGVVDLGL